MKGIVGGLWFAGLLAWAFTGILVPGLVFIGLGAVAGSWSWIKKLEKERQAASWRSQYPSYKY